MNYHRDREYGSLELMSFRIWSQRASMNWKHSTPSNTGGKTSASAGPGYAGLLRLKTNDRQVLTDPYAPKLSTSPHLESRLALTWRQQ